MRFALLSGFLRTPKPAPARRLDAPKRTALVSALSFAALLLLVTPHAHAATQACKDGVKATIEGEIRGWADGNDRLWVTIDDTSWDCLQFVIAVKKTEAKSCQPGGHGRATGIMTLHDRRNMDGSWNLTDDGPGKGPGLTSSFYCGGPRAEDVRPKSTSK